MFLLYLVPVGITTWLSGWWPGVAVGVVVALIHIDIDLQSPLHATAIFWNAGMLFGVMLTFVSLLSQVKLICQDQTSLRSLSRALAVGAVCACVFGGVGYVVDSAALLPVSHGGATEPHSQAAVASTNPLAAVTTLYSSCVPISRALLLGSRDPQAKTCVVPVKAGELTDNVPQVLYDLDGGAGTSLVLLSKTERMICRRPTDDFTYHQQRLRPYLKKQHILNDQSLPMVAEFAASTRLLAEMIAASTTWPRDLVPVAPADINDWPGFCLNELDKAVSAQDLPRAKRWSAELANAALSLHDLHRWLALLLDNYLTALDFQQRCESVYAAANKTVADYDPFYHLSFLPAGMVTLFGDANFLEVERQAELQFSVPQTRLVAIAAQDQRFATVAAVLPEYRDAYLQIANALSAANRAVLSQAAHSPYEHAFLASMLHRAQQSGTLEQLADAVRCFNDAHPQSTVNELMDVLMYRGHSYGGLEWADRFQPQLVEQSSHLHGSDVDVFEAACTLVRDFCRLAEYATTLTLRQSLERKQLDCIRATDMIAALYRNAGRPCIGHVRWSNGVFGHSVAVLLDHGPSPGNAILADAMNPSAKPEYWPDAYFQGHAWPPGMEDNAPPETVELYVRGLDNYLWAEGYLIRGSHAGTLSTAAIPYWKEHTVASDRKVSPGPYPQ